MLLQSGLPCQSKQSDFDDARLVTDTLGIELLLVDLSQEYLSIKNKISKSINKELTRESQINIKPRLRMATLYSIAQSLGYLVVGTGNLCEAIVGYTTKWGDSASDFNPIANFTVEEVLQIGEYLGVPEKIIKKAPSDGLDIKTDEEKLGIKYSQISKYIRTGYTDIEVKGKIDRLYKLSKHKREKIPTYEPKSEELKNYIF